MSPGATAAARGAESEGNGLSHSAEAIHQEVLIKASRGRIYRALTDAKQFGEVTELSYHAASTEISTEVGGAFSLFGGLIIGRHIEMLPGERLVQAWREKPWEPGVYSTVRFALEPAGRFLFVADEDSDRIVPFSSDGHVGKLPITGSLVAQVIVPIHAGAADVGLFSCCQCSLIQHQL